MDLGKEFEKYAIKHKGINSNTLDDYQKKNGLKFQAAAPVLGAYGGITNLTPNVIEERQLNVAQMDVFSRLMMDRIIFLGDAIYDQNANIIQAQLLFLQSADANRDIQIYINSPGGSVYAGLGIYDTMQYISPDVATICTGMAASMGAILLCAGEKGKRLGFWHSGLWRRCRRRRHRTGDRHFRLSARYRANRTKDVPPFPRDHCTAITVPSVSSPSVPAGAPPRDGARRGRSPRSSRRRTPTSRRAVR